MYNVTALNQSSAQSVDSLQDTLCQVVRDQCPSLRSGLEYLYYQRCYTRHENRAWYASVVFDTEYYQPLRDWYSTPRYFNDAVNWTNARIINTDCRELRVSFPIIDFFFNEYLYNQTGDFVYGISLCSSESCANVSETNPCIPMESFAKTGCCHPIENRPETTTIDVPVTEDPRRSDSLLSLQAENVSTSEISHAPTTSFSLQAENVSTSEISQAPVTSISTSTDANTPPIQESRASKSSRSFRSNPMSVTMLALTTALCKLF